ncbi:hypothetical protein [Sphingorhabdus sp.]|jgi:hypothetical protein|uniref:hypothetical protein n=1 Tax=Sphingorhabdus sp. TaxID=1902408 RepID=UPI0037C758A4
MVFDRSNGIYRSIFAAIIGLALVGAGKPPQPSAKAEQQEANGYVGQSSPSMATSKSETIEPINSAKKHQPCGNGRYTSDDDLCAQWKAADAARDAANWARWQLGISAAGLLALIVSLFFTRRALVAADNTNKAFIRAEAGILVPSIEFFGGGLWADSFKIKMHNVGRTPVTIVHYQLHLDNDNIGHQMEIPLHADEHQLGIMIDAGKPFILPYNDMSQCPEVIRMVGGAIYSDMFGRISTCQIAYLVNRCTRTFTYDREVNFSRWDKLAKKQNKKNN